MIVSGEGNRNGKEVYPIANFPPDLHKLFLEETKTFGGEKPTTTYLSRGLRISFLSWKKAEKIHPDALRYSLHFTV